MKLLKNALDKIKSNNPTIFAELSDQNKRINDAIESILIWIESNMDKNPLMITGNSGSSKSYITKRLFEGLYGKDNIVYCLPPSKGNYEDIIQLEIDRKPKFKFILIDESHSLDFDIESIQPESNGVMIAERYIKKSQLVFISHEGLGNDSSQDARLEPVEFAQISRDEIINILMDKYGFTEDCANWSAWHSPRNIHNAIQVSKFFGTEQQLCKNPCGLKAIDLEVLRYYQNSARIGNNTITSCANSLSVNAAVVRNSERRLTGEGLLAILKQSKRSVTEHGLDLLYTIDDPEAKSEPEPEPSNATPKQPSKATPPKAKRKTPTSKLDNIKPDKSPSQLYAEISSQIVKPMDPLAKLD